MMGTAKRATTPEDVSPLFVEFVNAGDVDGMLSLYEPDAVLDYPVGNPTVGHDALRAVFERMVANRPRFAVEEPLPTLRHGDIALTATRPLDDTGGRVQVVRRQPDCSWRRVIDRPEATGA